MKPVTSALAALFTCLIALSHPASAETAHDAHSQHGAMTLSLDQGKPWQTDAPLRAGMDNLRAAFAEKLHAIHEDRMSAEDYQALGGKTRQEVGAIVAQCKLTPEADAMLHLIIAELLSGADIMTGKAEGAPREGAHKAVMALDNYGRYFDHPGWVGLE
jgi:hypothetical protein